MRTASATFNRKTGKFTIVVGGSGSEPASRATKELPSVLHEGVASIVRRYLASDPAIREAYLQIGKSYYGENPLITVTIFVEADGTMLENERAFNWIRRNCAEHDLFFDLWVLQRLRNATPQCFWRKTRKDWTFPDLQQRCAVTSLPKLWLTGKNPRSASMLV